MSDTAFFIRPPITPAEGAKWLCLDNQKESTARTVKATGWRLGDAAQTSRLAIALANDDEEATGQLARQLYPRIVELAGALVPQRQSVTELTSSMTAAILRKLKKTPSRATTLAHWAPRLAVRQALRLIAREDAHLGGIKPQLADLDLLRRLKKDTELDSDRSEALATELLSRVLGRLAPRHRLLFTLVEIRGWSIEGLDSLFGWPRLITRLQLGFARRRFHQVLESWWAAIR